MKLTLGISPCPNDTYIFDALLHHKIDTEGLDFDIHFEDVETLNLWAKAGKLDITKLSFFAFTHFTEHYALLDSGAALGFGVGPLIIGKPEKVAAYQKAKQTDGSYHFDKTLVVGIPGQMTTANFLFSVACAGNIRKEYMLFSDIEKQLIDGKIDLGVIIHENRFTYQQKGLAKLIDLGDFWEQKTQSAIPLGGIVVKRSFAPEIQQKINRVIRRSIEFANQNPKSGLDFIRCHAQEMTEEVMYQHIKLYVNQYSISLGDIGKKAVDLLFSEAKNIGLIKDFQKEYWAK